MKNLNLKQTPEILQKAVGEYLQERPGAKLLGVKSNEMTPYKDKSIRSTAYVAYIENFNLMVTLNFTECSVPDWSNHNVHESWLSVADIGFFIENSSYFYVK